MDLATNRALTAAFISFDPIDIVLVPRVRAKTQSGGWQFVNQPPRASQRFKLIRMSATQRPVVTVDGVDRVIDYTLLGKYDALMDRYDIWTDGPYTYEIVEIVPENGYQTKGLVDRRW
jgi:hypothetical protein